MSDDLYNLALDIRERVRYLHEIGVDSMGVELADLKTDKAVVTETSHQPPIIAIPVQPAKKERPAGSRLAELPSLSQRSVMPSARISPSGKPGTPVSEPSIGPVPQALTAAIEAIRAEIGNCVRCPLHEGRTQVVHSTGNFAARLMFVGEAPGADEDIEGKPFVGRAGKLLTSIIESIGFRREDVFIGNINRCRPPGNRQPLPLETEACRPFLLREVAVIKPKVIVVLGNTATQNLLGIKTPISKIRGQFQDYFGVKVMPTFHPAYLLRDPHKKREVWEDMKKVRDYVNAIPV
jgi:uracil-DNA glycosylase